MSDWTVHLEFEEGTSSKFWRARVEDKTLYVNYGKIGANGQTQVKDFASPDAAQRELDKLVKEKRKKGYEDAADGAEMDEDAEDAEDAGEDGDDETDDGDAAAGGIRLVLDAGGRKVVTRLVLDGKTVRLDAIETFASPDAATQAHDRLKQALIAEGFREP